MALKDRTVAILVGAGTAAAELNPVQQALAEAGAEVILVGKSLDDLEAHVLSEDLTISVGLGLDVAKQVWFDAVVIPGGEGVDAYRGSETVYDFLGDFDTAGKPIAAIGRGVWLLIDSQLLDGRRIAAPEGMRPDIEAVGGELAPCPFTLDRPLYTACGPEGVPQLIEALVCALQSVHLPARALENPIVD